MNKLSVTIYFVMLCSSLSAQDSSTDLSGKYSYSVVPRMETIMVGLY